MFACIYVCTPHVFLLPDKARGTFGTVLTEVIFILVLKIEPMSCTRAARALNLGAVFSGPLGGPLSQPWGCFLPRGQIVSPLIVSPGNWDQDLLAPAFPQ